MRQAPLQGRNLFELSGQALAQARRDVQIIVQDLFAQLDPPMRVADILDEGMVAQRPDLGEDTHDIGVVEYVADHVAAMRCGRIVEQGNSVSVLENPQGPSTHHLVDSLPRPERPA